MMSRAFKAVDNIVEIGSGRCKEKLTSQEGVGIYWQRVDIIIYMRLMVMAENRQSAPTSADAKVERSINERVGRYDQLVDGVIPVILKSIEIYLPTPGIRWHKNLTTINQLRRTSSFRSCLTLLICVPQVSVCSYEYGMDVNIRSSIHNEQDLF